MKFYRQGRIWPCICLMVSASMSLMTTGSYAETFGTRARQVLASIDNDCRERKLGPYQTDSAQSSIRNSSCDILFLKPYDPLATPEGRFAQSINLPDKDRATEIYIAGMSDRQYFDALCK